MVCTLSWGPWGAARQSQRSSCTPCPRVAALVLSDPPPWSLSPEPLPSQRELPPRAQWLVPTGALGVEDFYRRFSNGETEAQTG